MTVRILTGDCRELLHSVPAESVQCVVTSPPYFGLRDYGVAGQIGLEASPEAFVAEMVAVFREVRRVLRTDGTCWLNLGDSYNGTGARAPNIHDDGTLSYRAGTAGMRLTCLKSKDLLMMPARVALALQADGWWLRKEIIWAKPNPMPESCTDRPTSSHEKVYLLAKSATYFYDADAVREGLADLPSDRTSWARTREADPRDSRDKHEPLSKRRAVKVPGGWDQGEGGHGTMHRDGRTSATYQDAEIKPGRNLRDVWTIATAPFPEAHFATFPPRLAEICIQAGTSARGCCPGCGAPWRRTVERGDPDLQHQRASGGDAEGAYTGQSTKGHAAAGVQDASAVKARILAGMVEKRTSGWQPTCTCPEHQPIPCTVLDPFGGAGTTGLVADRLGRDAVLLELNPEYAAMARRRIDRDAPLFVQAAE